MSLKRIIISFICLKNTIKMIFIKTDIFSQFLRKFEKVFFKNEDFFMFFNV
jgi:hypothetical protein